MNDTRPAAAPDGSSPLHKPGPSTRRTPDDPRSSRNDERGSLTRVLPDGRRFLRRHRSVLFALSGWSLLESAQTFLGGYGVARSLDDGFLAGRTGTGLLWLCVAAGATLLGGFAVRQVFRGLAALVEPFRDGLMRRAVDQALGAALAEPARADPTGAVSRLTHQTEIARDSFAGLVLTARSFVFTTAGALLGMASLDPALLFVVLPPLLAGLILFLSTFPPMAAAQRAYLDADEALSALSGQVASGLRDVAACGAGARVAAEIGRLIAVEERLSRRLARWAAVRSFALGVAGRLPLVVLLAATPLLIEGGLTAGALLGALTYLVQALLPALHALMTAVGTAGTRLLVVLERFTDQDDHSAPNIPPIAPIAPIPAAQPSVEPGAHPSGQPPADDPRPACPARSGRSGRTPAAELRGVTFAYGTGARPVLRELDLTVEDGEHLVVVGPSGIGKSTLTSLLAGILTPDAGSVRVAGAAPGPDGPAHPQPRRTLLPQRAYVFSGTVGENLAYFRPDASRADLDRATRLLGLEGLVRRLGGLHGRVDPRLLSLGECQQLAVGRAYVSPAPLLLLDEATCHLDPETEERTERVLAERPGTLVLVAHRISSALRADRVLVLDGDRALCAPHDALLAESELYRDLVGRWYHEPGSAVEERDRRASERRAHGGEESEDRGVRASLPALRGDDPPASKGAVTVVGPARDRDVGPRDVRPSRRPA
ncbi:ATP-binding cassette domain-containing protein [Streptomyces sp. NPDC048243]|uniref:ATP-binding cassette domain-containing protein n=1 Tax=Streptomyces sp. NPDC048243 TaxID=3365522 RepID=UPI0037166D32